MAKLTFHIQKPGIEPWLKTEIVRSRVNLLKIMHPDLYDGPPLGGMTYIGRLWFGQGEPDKQLIYKGKQGADEWMAMAEPKLAKCRWCQIIEGPNEPYIVTEEEANALAQFERWRTYYLNQIGHQTLSYCFSVGNPELNLWPILGQGIGDYLGLHEYGYKTMNWDTYWLGRYRRVLEILAQSGYAEPRIIISETGIDENGNPETSGWRYQLKGDEAEYVRQLQETSEKWDKDEAIIAATPFTWQDETWPSFAHNESVTKRIVDWLASSPADIGKVMAEIGQQHIIPLNYNAALLKAGTARGYSPVSPEYQQEIGGIQYVGQMFIEPGNEEIQWCAYCACGDWGNVIWTARAN